MFESSCTGEIQKELHSDECIAVFAGAHCTYEEICKKLPGRLDRPNMLLSLVKSDAWNRHLATVGFSPVRIGRLISLVDPLLNDRLQGRVANPKRSRSRYAPPFDIPSPPPMPLEVHSPPGAISGLEQWAEVELEVEDEWGAAALVKGEHKIPFAWRVTDQEGRPSREILQGQVSESQTDMFAPPGTIGRDKYYRDPHQTPLLELHGAPAVINGKGGCVPKKAKIREL